MLGVKYSVKMKEEINKAISELENFNLPWKKMVQKLTRSWRLNTKKQFKRDKIQLPVLEQGDRSGSE